MKSKIIHFFGGFTEEEVNSKIKEIQDNSEKKIQQITLEAQNTIKSVTEDSANRIKEITDNASIVYKRGKILGQYKTAAYFIAYAKSLYGRKDWSSKMFSLMTEFLDSVENSQDDEIESLT